MGNMTRDEAIRWTSTAFRSLKFLNYYNEETLVKLDEALDIVIEALKQPDPETGLVPCGCGGKAVLRKDVTRGNKEEDLLSVTVWRIKCPDCDVSTAECFYESAARNDWNTAMGYKHD